MIETLNRISFTSSRRVEFNLQKVSFICTICSIAIDRVFKSFRCSKTTRKIYPMVLYLNRKKVRTGERFRLQLSVHVQQAHIVQGNGKYHTFCIHAFIIQTSSIWQRARREWFTERRRRKQWHKFLQQHAFSMDHCFRLNNLYMLYFARIFLNLNRISPVAASTSHYSTIIMSSAPFHNDHNIPNIIYGFKSKNTDIYCYSNANSEWEAHCSNVRGNHWQLQQFPSFIPATELMQINYEFRTLNYENR